MTLLDTRIVEKPWGRSHLPPPFRNAGGDAVGEIWFVPPPGMDGLLIKYIFTSEALSVQCHPSDAQTQAMGLGKQGKDECWLVLDAEPQARLAIGFRQRIDAKTMREAASDGSIEDLLMWHPVVAGDVFYIPANTVHAIGGGLTLVEVQQNSDMTYRLYDYGRPRELHLDQGVSVASGEPYPEGLKQNVCGLGTVRLVDGPYFRLDLLDSAADAAARDRYRGALLVLPLDCTVRLDDTTVSPGQCGLAEDIEHMSMAGPGRCLIAQPLH